MDLITDPVTGVLRVVGVDPLLWIQPRPTVLPRDLWDLYHGGAGWWARPNSPTLRKAPQRTDSSGGCPLSRTRSSIGHLPQKRSPP